MIMKSYMKLYYEFISEFSAMKNTVNSSLLLMDEVKFLYDMKSWLISLILN